jgi:hypothetical protein
LKVAASVDAASAAAKRKMIVMTPTRYVIACVAILLPECYMEPTAIRSDSTRENECLQRERLPVLFPPARSAKMYRPVC